MLCRSPSLPQAIPGLKPVPLLPVTASAARPAAVRLLVERTRVADRQGRAQRLVLRKARRQDLLAKADKHGEYEHSTLETYDYPGGYDNKGDGEKMAEGARRGGAGARRSSHRHRLGAVVVSRRQVHA